MSYLKWKNIMLELFYSLIKQRMLIQKSFQPNVRATVNKTVNSNVPRPEQCEEDAFVFLTSWCQVKVQSTSAYTQFCPNGWFCMLIKEVFDYGHFMLWNAMQVWAKVIKLKCYKHWLFTLAATIHSRCLAYFDAKK